MLSSCRPARPPASYSSTLANSKRIAGVRSDAGCPWGRRRGTPRDRGARGRLFAVLRMAMAIRSPCFYFPRVDGCSAIVGAGFTNMLTLGPGLLGTTCISALPDEAHTMCVRGRTDTQFDLHTHTHTHTYQDFGHTGAAAADSTCGWDTADKPINQGWACQQRDRASRRRKGTGKTKKTLFPPRPGESVAAGRRRLGLRDKSLERPFHPESRRRSRQNGSVPDHGMAQHYSNVVRDFFPRAPPLPSRQ